MLDIFWWTIALSLILLTLPGAIELFGLTIGAILHLCRRKNKK